MEEVSLQHMHLYFINYQVAVKNKDHAAMASISKTLSDDIHKTLKRNGWDYITFNWMNSGPARFVFDINFEGTYLVMIIVPEFSAIGFSVKTLGIRTKDEMKARIIDKAERSFKRG